MAKWADENLFEELSARDYDTLTEEEKSLLEQLCVEYDAEAGYDYYEDDYDDIENTEERYSEIFYMDDEGNECDKAVAKRCIIRELDADGNLIQETFGFVN